MTAFVALTDVADINWLLKSMKRFALGRPKSNALGASDGEWDRLWMAADHSKSV